jgi:hypothetical protein
VFAADTELQLESRELWSLSIGLIKGLYDEGRPHLSSILSLSKSLFLCPFIDFSILIDLPFYPMLCLSSVVFIIWHLFYSVRATTRSEPQPDTSKGNPKLYDRDI